MVLCGGYHPQMLKGHSDTVCRTNMDVTTSVKTLKCVTGVILPPAGQLGSLLLTAQL